MSTTSTLTAILEAVSGIGDEADYGTGFELESSTIDPDSGEEILFHAGGTPWGMHTETLRPTRRSGPSFADDVVYDGNVTADEYAADQLHALDDAPAFVLARTITDGFVRHDGSRARGLLDYLAAVRTLDGVRLAKDTVKALVGCDQVAVLNERTFINVMRDTAIRALTDGTVPKASRRAVTELIEALPAVRHTEIGGEVIDQDPVAKLRKVLTATLQPALAPAPATAAVPTREVRAANANRRNHNARRRTGTAATSASRPGAIGSVATGRRHRHAG